MDGFTMPNSANSKNIPFGNFLILNGYDGAVQSTLSFNEIFSDAITGNVIYVKYNNLNGIPSFDVYIADDFRKKKIFIRTKNGNTRSNDKLGIQT